MRRAWLTTLSLNAIFVASGLISGVLIARVLGPEARGVLASGIFWPTVFSAMARCGIDEAVIWRYNQRGADSKVVLGTAIAITLLASAGTSATAALLLPALLGHKGDTALTLALVYAVTWVPVNNLNVVLTASEQAEMRFLRANTRRVGPTIVYCLIVIALWLTELPSVAAIVTAMVVGELIVLGFGETAGLRCLNVASRNEAAKLLKIGLRFHAGGLAALISNNIDRAVVVTYLQNDDIGQYVIAWTYATVGFTLLGAVVAFVLVPHIAASGNSEETRRVLTTVLRRTNCAVIGLASVGALLAPFVVPSIFGGEYRPAVQVALPLIFAAAGQALRQIIVRALRGLGEAGIGVTTEVVTIGGFIGIVAIISGAAAGGLGPATVGGAAAFANGIGLLVAAFHLRKRHQIPFGSWVKPSSADVIAVRKWMMQRVMRGNGRRSADVG